LTQTGDGHTTLRDTRTATQEMLGTIISAQMRHPALETALSME